MPSSSSSVNFAVKRCCREFGSSVGESHMMAAAEACGMWQRTAAKCQLVQEDAIRSPKVLNCPLPCVVSRSQPDACHHMGYSYHWSNSWGSVDPHSSLESKLDLQWQFSLSTHTDYHSDLNGFAESPNTRFSKPAGLQSLAAESNFSAKSSPGLLGAACDATEAELELEWQLIVDPQLKSGLAAAIYNKGDEEVEAEEAVKSDSDQNELQRIQEVNTCEVKRYMMMLTSNIEVLPDGSLDREQVLPPKLGPLFQEISDHQDLSTGSSMESSLLWRGADKEVWSGLVAQKAVDCLEHYDLPCPLPRLILNAAWTSVDRSSYIEKQRDLSRPFDKNLLANLLQGSEPTDFATGGLSSSALIINCLDPTPAAPVHCQRLCEPLAIPCTEVPPLRCGPSSVSVDGRYTRWSGGGAFTLGQGSGLLGEALCRSQTRAREAEKKVQRAFEEKEQLMNLFFKEASLAFTYRQWVTTLQNENMWLRMSTRREPVARWQQSIFNPLSPLERLSGKRWKDFGQDYHAENHMDHNISVMCDEKGLVFMGDPNDIMMGYTLAFALGSSLAGAGLMLGWSMGWILLAC